MRPPCTIHVLSLFSLTLTSIGIAVFDHVTSVSSASDPSPPPVWGTEISFSVNSGTSFLDNNCEGAVSQIAGKEQECSVSISYQSVGVGDNPCAPNFEGRHR